MASNRSCGEVATRLLTFVAALSIASTLFATGAEVVPTYIETFEVRVHNLDVIVTDRAGNTVRGLTKNDFVVLEDGVAQEISNFSAFDESAGSATTPAADSVAMVPPPPVRSVIFFVDEMALHPATRAKLVQQAMKLMDSLSPRDQAVVVTATGERSGERQFTTDRATIRAALEAAMRDAHSRTSLQTSAEQWWLESQMRLGTSKAERRNIRKHYAAMVKRRVEQRLGTLRALVASVAGIEGKKVLVVMSAALEAEPGREEADQERSETIADFSRSVELLDNPVSTIVPVAYDLRPLIADLGRTAAASGVTIYPLQPDTPLEGAVPGTVESRDNVRRRAGMFGSVLRNHEQTMVSLAETTGGSWFRGDGRIDDVFRQIASDVRSYYSLAYHARGDKDRPHQVVVRVKNRGDLRVRTRSEVQEKSAEREMADLTMAALLYRHDANELGIRAAADAPQRRRDVHAIPVKVRIPMARLAFLPAANDRHVATLRIHYAVTGTNRDFLAGEDREQRIDISSEQLRAIEGKQFEYTTEFVVVRGTWRVAVGVYDANSRLTGFDAVTVGVE